MRKYDLVGGFFWVILGIGLCAESIKLKIILRELNTPGGGFMPFLAGALLVALGFILIFSSLSKGLRKYEEGKDEKMLVKKDWKKFLVPFLNLLSIIVYILLLESLGFIFTTFLILFFLFKISEPKKWLMPLGLSVSTAILSYLVFSVWLQCQFPKGIFGF